MYDWNGLKAICSDCTKCSLCETRHNVVFGIGNEHADIMFVGEGPGEQEDPYFVEDGILQHLQYNSCTLCSSQ